MLSPPRVEGASLLTSPQVQERGKEPMHDEGPLGEWDIILDEDVDMGLQNAQLREIIKVQ